MEIVSRKENMPADKLMEGVANGTIAIPANINHTSLSPRLSEAVPGPK